MDWLAEVFDKISLAHHNEHFIFKRIIGLNMIHKGTGKPIALRIHVHD